MAIISIIEQPTSNTAKAAYRPVVLKVTATRTDGNVLPPLVYCDIYINGTFYKTIEKTQYDVLNSTNTEWDFDIQDAVQEGLIFVLATNGGTSIVEADGIMNSIYCKFRSSGFDGNGFITPEGTVPIQGTGTVAPVAGTGTQSNTFFVCASTLQHIQNQDLLTHLGYYKSGTWDASVFPLTHRLAGYRVCRNDSDYFPIMNLSAKTPLCINLFYKNTGDLSYTDTSKCGEAGCTGAAIPSFTLADAISGTAYSRTIALTGTSPFTISYQSIPGWMTASISGSNLILSGTPGSGDVGTNVPVSLIITNACGSGSAYPTINVDSACVGVTIAGTAENAYSGIAYSDTFSLTGTGPFTLSSGPTLPGWMSISLTDNEITISGTPGTGDVSGSVPISFTVTNACGSNTFSGNIEVIQNGLIFVSSTGGTGDSLNYSETENISGGNAGATVTIVVSTYTNSNGGTLKINGATVSSGYSFNVVLDGSGNGSFAAAIAGLSHSGTGILGVFTISATTSGSISTPNTYSISKTF